MRKLALIAAVVIVLTGCGQTRTANPAPRRQHYPVVIHSPVVLPAQRSKTPLNFPHFAHLISDTRLRIVTWGSGSCPHVPDELVVLSPHAIRIRLAMGSWTTSGLSAHLPANGICTTDIRTTPMLLAIDPKLVDVQRPFTVEGLQRGVLKVAPLKANRARA